MKTFRKIIAVLGGLLLLAAVVVIVLTKDDELLGLVIVFGVLYFVYLGVLISKAKKDTSETKSAPQSPLSRRK